MENILGSEQEPQGETQAAPALTPEHEQEATPPVAEGEKHVPLAALEAERGQRKDWKEKALRYEGRIAELERQRSPAPTQQEPVDPIQQQFLRMENIALNASERMARKAYGDEEVDKALARIQPNQQLIAQALQQADPWDFVVQEGKKLAMLEELGSDPAAYRARLEAEILAKHGITSQKTPLPTSLASTRSAGARSTGWTGPPPFDQILG